MEEAWELTDLGMSISGVIIAYILLFILATISIKK